MWMRFLIDFFSGTIWKQMGGPSPFGSSMMSVPLPSSSSGTPIDLKKSSHESKPDGGGCDDVVQRLGPEMRERFG
jgi:hypothetical protein